MNKMVVPNEILLEEAADLLSRGIEVILMTKGNSMLPFIRGEKDSVNLKKYDTVKVGDIVLARIAPHRYVLHRIFAIDGDQLTLMGDGNLLGTESCRSSDVLGTVHEIIRPNGSVKRVTDGSLWRKLLPVRRYLLWIYRIIMR
jgi:SOS-response transcriptional repressor LexA